MINKDLVKKIEEQMEEADDLFDNNIKGLKERDFRSFSVAKKRSKAHIMGVIIEQYLKALLLWKGKTWKNLKNIGHGLANLYKVLDDEGKKILHDMLGIKPESHINKAEYFDSSVEFSEIDNFPSTLPTGYITNGQYDGKVAYPNISIKGFYTTESVEDLLKKIKVPDYRYSQNNLNLSDNDLVKMYQIVRCLNVLSRIARGENAKEVVTDIKKR